LNFTAMLLMEIILLLGSAALTHDSIRLPRTKSTIPMDQ